ncbi:MAG: DUF167 domain-containing protein [Dehalococcoidales bacterium]
MNTVKISVLVQPNAPRSRLTGFEGGIWQIKVAAPPLKGRANRELEIFLSQRLQVSKSAVSVVKGQTSRHKTVAINGLNQEEVARRLMPKPSSFSGDARNI